MVIFVRGGNVPGEHVYSVSVVDTCEVMSLRMVKLKGIEFGLGTGSSYVVV
jgi:hypothetical protein